MTAITLTTNGKAEIAHRSEMEISRDQIELIKRTVAKGVTDDEFQLFLYTAKRMGLDPLAKQIHAVKRWSNADSREVMSIQTGIDGYRLIADRTGNYAPGKANSYEYDENGKVISATAYAMKFVRGAWMETSATAHMSEYAQTKKDGSFTSMWASKPHIMLGKCAEALALRRAFPAELSGVYTDDEMAQADNESVTVKQPKQIPPPAQQVKPTNAEVEPAPTGLTLSKVLDEINAMREAQKFSGPRLRELYNFACGEIQARDMQCEPPPQKAGEAASAIEIMIGRCVDYDDQEAELHYEKTRNPQA